jgi:hypothetical protein
VPVAADPDVQRLLDEQEIRAVVLRYCRGIDRLDFELVRDCYHADATDHHGTFALARRVRRVGRRGARPLRGTMHVVANQLVEVAGARAHAETYGVAYQGSRPTTIVATSPPGSLRRPLRAATAPGGSRRGSRCRWTQKVTPEQQDHPPDRDGWRGRATHHALRRLMDDFGDPTVRPS